MSRLQFWATSLVAALALMLMGGSLVVQGLNRSLQADVGQRQQYVQQSVQLETLYREIVRALAELGARNNDTQVRDMLQKNGITYAANAAPGGAAAAPGNVPGNAPALATASPAATKKQGLKP